MEMKQNNRMKANTILTQMQAQFARVLPKIITPERFVRVVLTAMGRNPALADALADPRNQASVLSALMRCAEMGLEPDGRRAAITCYRRGNTGMYDVTLIPMYQGLAELAMRSGLISTIHTDRVCEYDDFAWENGEVRHRIDFKHPRGEAYAYYCIVRFKDGAQLTEVMSREEVEGIMLRSSGYQGAKQKGKTSTPWMTDFGEMARKTVFRRVAKWLPLSPEMRTALDADDEDYTASREVAKSVAADATLTLSTAKQEALPEAEAAQEEPELVAVSPIEQDATKAEAEAAVMMEQM